MNKKTLCLAGILFLTLNAFALDLGVIAGSVNKPSSFVYGLSATFAQIRLKNRAQRGFFVRRLCKSDHILSNGCPMKPTLFSVSLRACGD